MSTPFLGEVRMFGFAFPPRGWALCAGQILSIQQNQALFSLLGTTYGGNGVTTFALPDMRSRVPVHPNQDGSVVLGERFGEETHTLLVTEVPAHTHVPNASADAGSVAGPVNNLLAASKQEPYVTAPANTVMLHGGTIAPAGGSQPHDNRQPYLTINACIALQGVYPSRN